MTSKRIAIALTLIAALGLGACNSAADVASENLSQAADNFEITRRIIFFNGITDSNLLVIEGRCSLGNYDSSLRLSVTCKTSNTEYKKHFLGLSDNTSWFAEQLETADVSEYHYRVFIRPQTILPDLDLQGNVGG